MDIRTLQADILQSYLDQKSEQAISNHIAKINEQKQQANEEDVVSQAKLVELENQLETFQKQLQVLTGKLHNDTSESVNTIKHRFDRECHRFSAALPMYAYQSHIIDMVNNSQVTVLIGETGSGKSTQICQYLYDHGFAQHDKKIVCTQPRKVAASSLAEHVAAEMKTHLGKLVGYQVGVKKHFTKHTKILYSTDHCLLNECLHDTLFNQYSVIVVDEAHERSIYTDLLIGLIKKCLSARPDLRVVITSATINPQIFMDYFGECPLLRVPGRMYPVEVSYVDDSESCVATAGSYLDIVIEKVRSLHSVKDPGDILVFVVTPADCEKCCERLADLEGASCLPLHGQLTMDQYKLVFAHPNENKRKVVVATNCAETSITISGIKYVVDSGLAKEKQFDAATNVGKLVVTSISKSSGNQRKGRAGRIEAGECFRLYTRQEFDTMTENSVPEILRVNLRQAMLHLIGLGITDPLSFEFVESPSHDSLVYSYRVLENLGAIDVDGGLSELGKQMVHVPIDPKLSKFVLMCCQLDMGFLSIVMAALTMQGNMIFYRGTTEREKMASDQNKADFIDCLGDVVTTVKVYEEWRQQQDHIRGRWCFEHSINSKAMKNAATTIKEVHGSLNKDCGIAVRREMNLDRLSEVMAEFVRCHFPSNVCLYSGNDRVGYFIPELQEYCRIHPSSALVYGGLSPQFAMFESILQTSYKFLCFVSVVDEMLCDPNVKEWLLREHSKQKVITVPFCSAGAKVTGKLYYKRFQIRNLLKNVFSHLLLVPEIRWYQKEGNQLELTVRQGDMQLVQNFIQEQFVTPIISDMLCEVVDVPVQPRSEVKVTVGVGILVKSCLMPMEFKSVKINLKRAFYSGEIDVHAVEMLLKPFGQVRSMRRVESQTEFWGYVEFMCPLAAKAATNHDFEKIVCTPNSNPKVQQGTLADNFQGSICCEWLRMPTRGHAYVNFPDGVLEDFTNSTFSMGSNICSVKRSRKNVNDLLITQLPEDCTETSIVSSGPEILQQRTKLVIPRFKPQTDIECDREEFRKILVQQLTQANFLPGQLKVLPYGKSVFRGLINLTSITSCLTFFDSLSNSKIALFGRRLKFSLTLDYSVSLRVDLYRKLEKEILAAAQVLNGDVQFVEHKGKLRGYLHIKSNDRDTANLLYDSIMKLVRGCYYECKEFIAQLLSSQQDSIIEKISDQSGAIVECDRRQQRLVLYGDQLSTLKAFALLDEQVAHLKSLKEVEMEINLRSGDRPTGLLKAILRSYRVDLAYLPCITGCLSVKLDIRHHIIFYVGSEDGWRSLIKVIDELAEKVRGESAVQDSSMQDCPICLCTVDSEKMQLTFCGHMYCMECFTAYIQNQIIEKKFPIVCAVEECQQGLYLHDIPDIEQNYQLISACVDHYLSVNQKTLKYCRSADCANFYRVTSCTGKFYCSLCSRTTCTCCHQDAHADDIPCDDANDPDNAVLKWMAADRINRSRCPNCQQGIEKDGGCLHVHCIKCKAHICWNCKNVYDTGPEVYNHRCPGRAQF